MYVKVTLEIIEVSENGFEYVIDKQETRTGLLKSDSGIRFPKGP
jgi:hypothetical protein